MKAGLARSAPNEWQRACLNARWGSAASTGALSYKWDAARTRVAGTGQLMGSGWRQACARSSFLAAIFLNNGNENQHEGYQSDKVKPGASFVWIRGYPERCPIDCFQQK